MKGRQLEISSLVWSTYTCKNSIVTIFEDADEEDSEIMSLTILRKAQSRPLQFLLRST